MYKPSTLAVAKPVVDALYVAGIALKPKAAGYPVGVLADHYHVNITPTHTDLTPEQRVDLKNHFSKCNEVQHQTSEQEFDQLVELAAHGLTRMLTTVQQVIVPFCKVIKSDFEVMVQRDGIPDISVTPFVYHAIHADSGLVEHVQHNYARVELQPQYRTFLMDRPSLDTLQDWVCRNTHVADESIKGWFAGLSAEVIDSTWYSLFDTDRSVDLATHYLFNRNQCPTNVDALLLAYFLTIYLATEPQDVKGESVSLEEWESAFQRLHNYFGATLGYAYQRRAQAVRQTKIILSSRVGTPEEGRIHVVVNGDTWTQWTESGGDVKQVLGAVLVDPARKHAKDLDDAKESLITAWDRKHYIYKSIKADKFSRARRSVLTDLLAGKYAGAEYSDHLPPLTDEVIRDRAGKYLATVTDKGLECTATVVKDLICAVWYPDTPYCEFLNVMERMGKEHVGMAPREVALFSTAEMLAQWLAKQISAYAVDYDIRQSEPVSHSTAVASDDAIPDTIEADNIALELTPDEAETTEYVDADEHGEVPPVKIETTEANDHVETPMAETA